jgi:hypothetical protein
MEGWLVQYNLFRPHMSLKDRTPAQLADIQAKFKNWKDVVEQPYEKTACIKVSKPETKPIKPPEVKVPKLKIPKTKKSGLMEIGSGIEKNKRTGRGRLKIG